MAHPLPSKSYLKEKLLEVKHLISLNNTTNNNLKTALKEKLQQKYCEFTYLYQQYPANANPAIPATLQPITITKEKKKMMCLKPQLHAIQLSLVSPIQGKDPPVENRK